MQQIIGKRFVWNGQDKSIRDKHAERLTVQRILSEEQGIYKILYDDEYGETISGAITEKELFLNYRAIRPTHVITYHRTKVTHLSSNNLYDLKITVCKYDPDAEQTPILEFDLYDWIVQCVVPSKKDKELYVKNDKSGIYDVMNATIDSNSSPSIFPFNNLNKEVYYCYLDSSCGSKSITGVIPVNVFSYLYGLTNKLEDYDDAYKIIGLPVQDLVRLEHNYGDGMLFSAIEFERAVLQYLGFVDVQASYGKTYLPPIGNGSAKDFIYFYDNAIKQDYSTLMRNNVYNWMANFLDSSCKSLAYPGIPFLPFNGIDFDRPVIMRLRKESDEELDELRSQLAKENKFVMQLFFKHDDSIALVIFDCIKPIDWDKPALNDEELAIFLKRKK